MPRVISLKLVRRVEPGVGLQSCQVGSHLKNPQFPIWVVCSESHFSLVFADTHYLVKVAIQDTHCLVKVDTTNTH
jgi:hypothetical protein